MSVTTHFTYPYRVLGLSAGEIGPVAQGLDQWRCYTEKHFTELHVHMHVYRHNTQLQTRHRPAVPRHNTAASHTQYRHSTPIVTAKNSGRNEDKVISVSMWIHGVGKSLPPPRPALQIIASLTFRLSSRYRYEGYYIICFMINRYLVHLHGEVLL